VSYNRLTSAGEDTCLHRFGLPENSWAAGHQHRELQFVAKSGGFSFYFFRNSDRFAS
jgi:hypothetical protein